ncbi:SURF1 family protein [Demequina capsici]|uniref:SURF1-like protein n=1 Tax=Demequina capsici TaxID=3075620 RepID=A0AA96FAS4_9MICO|nr:SURF1 family protein [Demequina sp. PMTSA13]WNM26808.1 SURF1 family protein [Demequina sp. PMTSA13]
MTAAQGRLRWGALALASLIMVAAMAITAGLGWWQWTRAHENGATVVPDPAVPLSELVQPGDRSGAEVGRQVVVDGTWADAEPFVVTGREVEGRPAQLLVRAFTVDADATGTGQPATLAVIVGWADADAAPSVAMPSGDVELEGYLRASESSAPASTGSEVEATVIGAVATSMLAQEWPGPLYSAVLVSYDGADGWEPLPPLAPTHETNFRNAAYAVEWWVFGGFAAFIALRWMRDNGRVRPAEGANPGPQEDQ